MKLKLIDILNAKTIINKLGSTVFSDGATSYKMMRNIRNLAPDFNDFETVKNQLIEKYGTKKENGFTEVMDDKKDEYFKELNAVAAQDIEVNISLINPDKLSGFSPFELMTIEWMLEPRKEI
jgi:hypothetical protein